MAIQNGWSVLSATKQTIVFKITTIEYIFHEIQYIFLSNSRGGGSGVEPVRPRAGFGHFHLFCQARVTKCSELNTMNVHPEFSSEISLE